MEISKFQEIREKSKFPQSKFRAYRNFEIWLNEWNMMFHIKDKENN